MISTRHACIFIHQRKCAGTSIIQAFGMQPSDAHWHYMNEGVLSPEYPRRPSRYFVFSVVRNPWERFVSGWQYCASTRQRALRDVLLDPPQSGHDYRHLTRPQADILFDANGRPAYHFLMRHETLQQDFDQVCDRIGKARMPLPRANVTAPDAGAPRDYRAHFDDECRALLAQRYARDIDLFGYSF